MKLEAGDKILLMSFDEAYEYVPSIDRLTERTILGIGKNTYNDIVSRNPHTVRRSNSREFQIENEPFVYEYWMVKRKIHSDIMLDDNLFQID